MPVAHPLVLNWNPPGKMTLKECHPENPDKGFSHTVTFYFLSKDKQTEIQYRVEGTYGTRVQDVPFKPILKGVMLEELYRIKQAIEASVSNELHLKSGGFRTI